MENKPHERLKCFLEQYQHLPKQRSAEWLVNRIETIGGSEIGTIAGTNKYETIRKLVSVKTKIKDNPSNIWMVLGSVFEEVVRTYLEKELDTKIYETGSIPGLTDDQGRIIQTYSPDGIGVVKKSNLKKFLKGYKTPQLSKLGDLITVLFEIKCPSNRYPQFEWNRATEAYHTQVKTGLDTIHNTDIGLYVDTVIRRCSLYDMKNNIVYNPLSKQTLLNLDSPITWGLIGIAKYVGVDVGVSKPKDEILSQYLKDQINTVDFDNISCWLDSLIYGIKFLTDLNYNEDNEEQPIVDLGVSSQLTLFNYLTKALDDNDYKLYYSAESCPKKALEDFKKYCRDNKYIPAAVLPWKMFDIKFILVEKEIGFVKQYRSKIIDTIENIRTINALPQDQKLEKLDELYPSKRKNKPIPPLILSQSVINQFLDL